MNTNEKSRTLDFTRLTGRGVKVAVVDSGIEPNHPKIGPIAGGVGLYALADGCIQREDDFSDRAGHGTACAGIIRKLAPAAELYGIRVFDESLTTDGQSLVEAVAWAIEEGMDVVNLSLGTIQTRGRATGSRYPRIGIRRSAISVEQKGLAARGHTDGVGAGTQRVQLPSG